jgi:hypothetical protein
MLKTITQDQSMDFYGKTNRGEFAWFVIFMGCLCAGGLVIIIPHLHPHDDNFIIVLLLTLALFIITCFIFYVGFIYWWEYRDNGRHAIERFWRRYKKGKLPKIMYVGPYLPQGEENIMSGGVEYIEFEFMEVGLLGLFHVGINVLIPMRVWEKIGNVIDKVQKESPHTPQVIQKGEKMEIVFKDGERVELVGEEEIEAFLFLSKLVREQWDRMIRAETLIEKVLRGEITPMEYAAEMWKK